MNFNIFKKKRKLIIKNTGAPIENVKREPEFNVFEEKEIRYIAPDDQIGIIKNYLESNPNIQESLAELDHKQWVQWADHMIHNFTPKNVAKWKLMISTPYEKLDKRDKESCMSSAQKVIKIVCGDEK